MMPPSFLPRPSRRDAVTRGPDARVSQSHTRASWELTHSFPPSLSRSAHECMFSRITTRRFDWDSPARVDLKGAWRVLSSLCINSMKMEKQSILFKPGNFLEWKKFRSTTHWLVVESFFIVVVVRTPRRRDETVRSFSFVCSRVRVRSSGLRLRAWLVLCVWFFQLR